MQQADLCISYGMPGLAIVATPRHGSRPVRYRLVDLYCQTGQPEEALKEDEQHRGPHLNTGPGTPLHRQGMFSFLLGNYENTSRAWRERAIPQLQMRRVQSLQAGRGLLRGDVKPPTTAGFRDCLDPDPRAGDLGIRAGLLPARVGRPEGGRRPLAAHLDLRPDLPDPACSSTTWSKRSAQPLRRVPRPFGSSTERSPGQPQRPAASLRRKRRSPRTFGSRPTIASLGLTAFGVRLEHSSSPEYC